MQTNMKQQTQGEQNAAFVINACKNYSEPATAQDKINKHLETLREIVMDFDYYLNEGVIVSTEVRNAFAVQFEQGVFLIEQFITENEVS